ncbi:MAG: relaxase [Pseudomonadota bacterium]
MVLKGNARGGAGDLAAHLMKDENEHIEVHELRGFASETLHDALHEVYAVSRGTQCHQFLYSLSLNPPEKAEVPVSDFEAAIEQAEKRLGLDGQPRAIVFHEKEGRRHAHAVWSRINVDEMKAIQMSYYHRRLKTLSRDLFIEHGWKMPPGLADSRERDPRNFTHTDWKQARRSGLHPHAIKKAIEDAWAISDSKAAFLNALEESGFKVARGDRRSFVAVDIHGEMYAIAKKAGVKTKDARTHLGNKEDYPSIRDVKARFATEMLPKVEQFKDDHSAEADQQHREFEARRKELVERQQRQRQTLAEKQTERRLQENQERQSRFRKGLGGLWDRLRGEHKRIQKRNVNEAEAAQTRDAREKHDLVMRHLRDRRQLNLLKLSLRRDYVREQALLERDKQRFEAERRQARDGPPQQPGSRTTASTRTEA